MHIPIQAPRGKHCACKYIAHTSTLGMLKVDVNRYLSGIIKKNVGTRHEMPLIQKKTFKSRDWVRQMQYPIMRKISGTIATVHGIEGFDGFFVTSSQYISRCHMQFGLIRAFDIR